MIDLRELYQEVILDHYRKPRNFAPLEGARHAEGHNPLCGDRVTVYLDVSEGEGAVVRSVSFQGAGCAISTASASLMTEAIQGKTVAEAERLFERFQRMLTGEANGDSDSEALGKLAALAGVREYPVRIKCATLAWHTLRAALDAVPENSDGNDSPSVSTE